MIRASIRPLARLAAGTQQLAECWTRVVSRRLAHAVDVWALSDVQPQLYLLACLSGRFGEPRIDEDYFASAPANLL